MGILNQFLSEAFTGPQLRDFRHASQLFTNNNYELSPKYQFLFFVRITLNSNLTRLPKDRQLEIGVLAKTVDLPKYTIDVKNFNAYNRPNLVQSKLKYDPINLKFHDDSSDIIREFWYDYYSYYYRDSDYTDALYGASHKYQPRMTQDWGYTPLSGKYFDDDNQMIKAIDIFSFHQKRFSCYTLQNPIITSFKHGSHAHDGTSLMEHDMSVQFETVNYSKGFVTPNNFGDMTLHYDLNPSPLTPAGGGTQSILGPGGILDAATDITQDLKDGNILGAIFKGGRAIQANKNTNLKGLAIDELKSIGTGILRGQNPSSRIAVPGVSDLIGGISKGVDGVFSGIAGGGGIGRGTGGSSIALLAGIGIAASKFLPSAVRDQAAAPTTSRAITSNGGSVVDTHYQAPDNWKREWPTIPSLAQVQQSAFNNPKFTDVVGKEYANINYDYEAKQDSNQNTPDFGDNFA
jgi:hypothetical protein